MGRTAISHEASVQMSTKTKRNFSAEFQQDLQVKALGASAHVTDNIFAGVGGGFGASLFRSGTSATVSSPESSKSLAERVADMQANVKSGQSSKKGNFDLDTARNRAIERRSSDIATLNTDMGAAVMESTRQQTDITEKKKELPQDSRIAHYYHFSQWSGHCCDAF